MGSRAGIDDYSAQEIDQGLTALILSGGSATKAHRLLNAQSSTDVPSRRSLADWARKHNERYRQLQTELAPRLSDQLAGDAEALASTYMDVQHAIAGHAATRLASPKTNVREISDLSNAARNFATAASLQLDKIANPARGRPTSVVAHQDPRAAMLGLAREMGIVIDATSEDMADTHALDTGNTEERKHTDTEEDTGSASTSTHPPDVPLLPGSASTNAPDLDDDQAGRAPDPDPAASLSR